jgi:hypothetical protein
MTSKYDNYGGSSGGNSGNDFDNVELRISPYASIKGDLDRVFGSSSQFGQSMGLNVANVELTDGAIYAHTSGNPYYKMFSWKEINGLTAAEALDRGETLTVDDADERVTRTYFGDTHTYELVAARVEPYEEDGEVLVEASSKRREVDMSGDVPEFTDYEDLGGEPVPFHNTITWFDGSQEHGPSQTSQILWETLSRYGQDSLVDTDDLDNWLPDTTGNNVLRDDLKDRTVELFTIQEETKDGNAYYPPIVLDWKTGERIRPNNAGDTSSSDSDSSSDDGGSQLAQAKAKDAGEYPEPIQDFIDSGRNLNMTPERANKMLDELVSNENNELTAELIEEHGGRDGIISQAAR